VLNYHGVNPNQAPATFAIPASPPTNVEDYDKTPNPETYLPPKRKRFGHDKFSTIEVRSLFTSNYVGGGYTTAKANWYVSIDGKPETPFSPPPVPTIFKPEETKMKIELNLGDTFDFVIYNHDILDHPYHVHGHHFYNLGSGYGTFDPVANRQDLNLKNPIRRDVHLLPPATPCQASDVDPGNEPSKPCIIDPAICGSPNPCAKYNPQLGGVTPSWTAFRLEADHVGTWLSHCHIVAHFNLGFGWVVRVTDETDKIEVPDFVPRSTFDVIRPHQEEEEEAHESYDDSSYETSHESYERAN